MPIAAESYILDGQSRHLREVAHRRLAAVRLPVCIGHKGYGRVYGRFPPDSAESLRIER